MDGSIQGQKTFWVRSMYGHNTRQPLVIITMPGGESLQVSPAEARSLAGNILHCAEAAETDAFLFEWSQESLGAHEETAGTLLMEFRKWREEHS